MACRRLMSCAMSSSLAVRFDEAKRYLLSRYATIHSSWSGTDVSCCCLKPPFCCWHFLARSPWLLCYYFVEHILKNDISHCPRCPAFRQAFKTAFAVALELAVMDSVEL